MGKGPKPWTTLIHRKKKIVFIEIIVVADKAVEKLLSRKT